jgi:hypothetical protein
MPMFWVLVTIFEISVALGFGFIVGRIYQIRCDELAGRDGGFTAPPSPAFPALDHLLLGPTSASAWATPTISVGNFSGLR